MPDPVIWGYKAIKPFDAEQPIGSGTLVHYDPGDEVPAGEWGRAEAFMVEAGTIMRYARNVQTVASPLPPSVAPVEPEPQPEPEPTPAPAGPADDGADDGKQVDSEPPVAPEGATFPYRQDDGSYLLSDGTVLRGKAKAIAAQAALEVQAEGGS